MHSNKFSAGFCIFVVLCFLSLGDSKRDLHCFVCDSEEDARCETLTPANSIRCETLSFEATFSHMHITHKNGPQSLNDQQTNVGYMHQRDYRCFQGKLQRKEDGHESFVRSCLLITSNLFDDSCDYLKDEIDAGYILSTCSTCNEDHCNYFNGSAPQKTFGHSSTDNGTHLTQSSLFYVLYLCPFYFFSLFIF